MLDSRSVVAVSELIVLSSSRIAPSRVTEPPGGMEAGNGAREAGGVMPRRFEFRLECVREGGLGRGGVMLRTSGPVLPSSCSSEAEPTKD